jgi:phosphoserine phosphatase RsbU/P
MAISDHQLLRALLSAIPDRIYFKDTAGRFLTVSRTLLDFFNLKSESEIKHKTDFDFFLPEHAQDAFNDEKTILATGQPLVAKIEKEILPEGTIRWVSTTKVPMHDESGIIIGTCGISRDITEEYCKTEQVREYSRILAEKQAEIEQEMVLARQIQQALLPRHYPAFPREIELENSAIRFAHRYLPNATVGGDFFAILPLAETQAGVFICDVMGHGVHAALITVVQRILVAEVQSWGFNPGAFLRELNQRLHRIFDQVQTPLFVTACYVLVDVEKGLLRYASAGHPTPILLRHGSLVAEPLPFKPGPKSFALGVMEDTEYFTSETSVAAGDKLFLYTDGLQDLEFLDPEIHLESSVFLSLIAECAPLPGGEFLDAVLQGVKELAGSSHFLDDVCLLSVEIDRLLPAEIAGAD